MQDYFRETEYNLDEVWVPCLGGRYHGRGVLSWKPEKGFHVEAFLERQGHAPPSTRHYGKAGIVTVRQVRMRPHGYDWAITPPVVEEGDFRVIETCRLSLDVDRVVFCKSLPFKSKAYASGSALYATSGRVLFPHILDEKVRLDGQLITERRSGGFRHSEDELLLRGYRQFDSNVRFGWHTCKTERPRKYWWDWAIALRDFLSIIQGETVQLLWREMSVANRSFTEVRRKDDLVSLGYLSPLGTPHKLTVALLMRWVRFLVKNERGADVCRRMFKQMVEASRQRTWEARQFLIATILEAALRTIYEKPFAGGTKGINIRQYLRRFCKQYLECGNSVSGIAERWEAASERVYEAHKNLRHRNAHPDWLTVPGGAASKDALSTALDDVVLLSRFYGYMMMALAGFDNMEPVFPASHKEWKPAMTISGEC